MKCPDCKGKGAVIIDESHNEICDMCDGSGYVALVNDNKKCNDCHGNGGMVVDDDLQVDFEVCMKCDGYGWIYGGDDGESTVPKLRPTVQRRPGD